MNQYFDLLKNLIRKDISVRQMGTSLGILWSLINPAITVLTYTIVFKYIFQSGAQNFSLHLITGIVHWTLFATIIPQSFEWLTSNASILQKVNFPRMLIPIAGLCLNLYYWLFFFLIYILVYHFLGGQFGLYLLLYPVVLVAYIAFLFGLGLFLCVMFVTMRDVKHIFESTVSVLFWLVPIIWVTGQFSNPIIRLLNVNPMIYFFRTFESILYFNTYPNTIDLVVSLVLGVVVFVTGVLFFRKNSRTVTEHF